jgi:hypothetical protein
MEVQPKVNVYENTFLHNFSGMSSIQQVLQWCVLQLQIAAQTEAATGQPYRATPGCRLNLVVKNGCNYVVKKAVCMISPAHVSFSSISRTHACFIKRLFLVPVCCRWDPHRVHRDPGPTTVSPLLSRAFEKLGSEDLELLWKKKILVMAQNL